MAQPSYVLPVDNARYGYRHGQKSTVWPFGHPGVDLLPLIPRDRQDTRAAKDGQVKKFVGGTCQGFDWLDDEGVTHRYCHMDAFVDVGTKFKKGQVIAQMAPKGFMVPPGTTHLHWVAWKKGKQIDPLSLLPTTPDLASADIPKLFKEIWKRVGAAGDIKTFEVERERKVYKTYYDLTNTMTYWFQQVYPDGVHLSPQGNKKWQRKKEKVLLP